MNLIVLGRILAYSIDVSDHERNGATSLEITFASSAASHYVDTPPWVPRRTKCTVCSSSSRDSWCAPLPLTFWSPSSSEQFPFRHDRGRARLHILACWTSSLCQVCAYENQATYRIVCLRVRKRRHTSLIHRLVLFHRPILNRETNQPRGYGWVGFATVCCWHAQSIIAHNLIFVPLRAD